ncbi:MAG: alpha/beta fold hydrolase [Paracoccaceae bacterium]
MRRVRHIAIGLAGLIGLMWVFGPYEDATLTPSVDTSGISGNLDAYFAAREAEFDDIKPGVEKRVVWADQPNAETDWAVLYVHGFSASSEEIRPVPDQVADALGANLIYTRLRGHGRSDDALAEGSVRAWMTDVAEGLNAARVAGRRVLVISTSTGGTLVTAAAQDTAMMQDVAGVVFVAPNFGINTPAASLITWPAARWWLPKIAGERRSFEPRNEAHGIYWTTEYPSVALMPMAALIKEVVALDHSLTSVPALFWYSDQDRVVRSDFTAKVAAAWGGDTQVIIPELDPTDDPLAHVITGAIVSPSQTDATTKDILQWVRSLQ